MLMRCIDNKNRNDSEGEVELFLKNGSVYTVYDEFISKWDHKMILYRIKECKVKAFNKKRFVPLIEPGYSIPLKPANLNLEEEETKTTHFSSHRELLVALG